MSAAKSGKSTWGSYWWKVKTALNLAMLKGLKGKACRKPHAFQQLEFQVLAGR